jgi:hypothetical protein
LLEKVTIPNRFCHDEVDATTEKRCQGFAQTEIGIGVLALDEGQELDEEIEVAPSGIEAIVGGGTE